MKKLFVLLAFAFVLFIACDNYPQNVSVRTTYTTATTADSCYMLVWKGTDTNLNPLFEDGDYHALVLPSPAITVYKVPVGANKQFTIQMLANGQTFKIALVPFKSNISAPLTVSAFYVLPTPPAKATIINVEIF